MKYFCSIKSYLVIILSLVVVVLLGFGIFQYSLDAMECQIIALIQIFAEETVGIFFFSIVNNLGDFYLWSFISMIFFFYAYKRSRKDLKTSIKLGVFLILVTASTLFLKVVFGRSRPRCFNIVVYDPQTSFAYPSGHVSRAYALMILVQQRNVLTIILVAASLFLLSLSRIVLGSHFPTDVIGSLFVSFALHETTNIVLEKFAHPIFH